jgi:hypothetical protein
MSHATQPRPVLEISGIGDKTHLSDNSAAQFEPKQWMSRRDTTVGRRGKDTSGWPNCFFAVVVSHEVLLLCNVYMRLARAPCIWHHRKSETQGCPSFSQISVMDVMHGIGVFPHNYSTLVGSFAHSKLVKPKSAKTDHGRGIGRIHTVLCLVADERLERRMHGLL